MTETSLGLHATTESTTQYLITPERLVEFTHPLQAEMARRWVPLLREEASPSGRVFAYRTKASEFIRLVQSKTEDELNGNMNKYDLDNLVRQATYVKIAALDIGIAYKRDAGQAMYDKLVEKMHEKYPPDAVTELRVLGYTPLEAMRYLKGLFERGERYQLKGIVIPESEMDARRPRKPALSDPHQDISDTWQRSSFGSQLFSADRMPNLIGEIQELSDEFNDMSDEAIDSLSDPLKLASIIGEVGDVGIAVDGGTATYDRDQAVEGPAALDRMIDVYGKTPRFVRRGNPARKVMLFFKVSSERSEMGRRGPYSIPSPTKA